MFRAHIHEKAWLIGTRNCWALAELNPRNRNGIITDEFEEYAWFGTPDAAIRSAFDSALRKSDIKDFIEAYAESKRLLTEITKNLAPQFELRTGTA